MFLSVVTFIFVVPAFLIFGFVALIDEIKRACHSGKYSEDNHKSETIVRYETAEEEEARTNEYGYDDPKWGKL